MADQLATPKAECISDLAFDRLWAGELSSERKSEVEIHVANCSTCAARCSELQAQSAHFADEVWVEGLVQKAIGRKVPLLNKVEVRRRLPWAATALAAAAAVVILVLPHGSSVRSKGAAIKLELVVRAAKDGKVEVFVPGQILHPSDAIRFRLSTKKSGFLGIASIDIARENIYESARSWPANQEQLLESSITLDETLGAERIYAVVCKNPFLDDELRAALKKLRDDAKNDPRSAGKLLLPGCEESSVLFEKSK